MTSIKIGTRLSKSRMSGRVTPWLRRVVPVGLAILDATVILMVGLAVDQFIGTGQWLSRDISSAISLGPMATLLFIGVCYNRGHYCLDSRLHRYKKATEIIGAFSIALVAITAVLFMLKIGAFYSRFATVTVATSTLTALLVLRWTMTRVVIHALAEGFITPLPVGLVAVGMEADVMALKRSLRTQGRRVTAVWRFNEDGQASQFVREVVRDLDPVRVRELLIVGGEHCFAHMENLSDHLQLSPVRVLAVLPNSHGWLARTTGVDLGDFRALEVSAPPISELSQLAKRVFDVATALTALMLLIPLFALVGAAIRLNSPGPAYFLQRREGFGGRTFLIYKFRTMHVTEDGPIVRQAKRNDDRVTPIGRWLRSSSIDELPQLWNVLRGEMSIVGPRPHAIAHGDLYSGLIDEYANRHNVKPGLTGWAQVNGSRGETPTVDCMKRRVALDIWYIENWSLLLDLQIVLRTVWLTVKRSGAY